MYKVIMQLISDCQANRKVKFVTSCHFGGASEAEHGP